jgi:hypothetical protein
VAVKIAGPLRQPGRDSAATPRAVRWLPRSLVLVVVGAACAGLFWCYLRLSETFPGGADGASNALEAWDMLHGNWLLHGWTLTDVAFYTTELPEYAAIELARGLGPGVLHAAMARAPVRAVARARRGSRGRHGPGRTPP